MKDGLVVEKMLGNTFASWRRSTPPKRGFLLRQSSYWHQSGLLRQSAVPRVALGSACVTVAARNSPKSPPRRGAERSEAGWVCKSSSRQRAENSTPLPPVEEGNVFGVAKQFLRPLFFLIVSALLVGPLAAQDNLTNVPDPDPAAQQAALHVAEGFEVNLFATDPMIDPPIQMAWDEQGRLWVATSTSYPQPVPGQAINDKIFVLEDTDGDGQADRSTVFADGLLTPTGILPGDGGVYVANSTEILHLRDTDGDGQADARRVVLSGFGADDTHHLIHTFRWGPDGLFYLNQSVYIYSHIETPWGVRRLRGGGIWQFDPATLRLDVFARGMWNSWGYDVDAWGQSFATDGAGFQGLHFIFPQVAYAPSVGAERVLEGLNPDHPKYAGLALISGRHFPETWNGDLITNDYRANRVKRFVLTEDASGFRADEQDDLIWTDHVAFRPVDVNVGPDGALYFADWYNPIIQHGEVDFRDPRRDHRHGRIWRLTAKGRSLVTPPMLHEASVDDLLDALRLPEDWTRRQAKRLLRERGAAAVQPRLDVWVRALDRNAPNATHDLLETLWTYQAIGVVEPSLLGEVLAADDHRARAAAVRVLYHQHDQIPGAEALLATAVTDVHPRVRREALHALGQRESADAARLALAVLDQPMDAYLDYALWHTLRALVPHWLPRFEADARFLGDDPRKITFALKSVDDSVAIAHLTRRYQDGQVPDDEAAEVLTVIAKHGSPDDLNTIFVMALDGARRGENGSVGHLKALETATREYDKTPAGDPTRLQILLDATDDSLRAHAARLVGLWTVTSLRPSLQRLVEAEQESEFVQQAALEGLAAMGDAESQAYLAALAGPDYPMPIRMHATRLLPSLDVEAAAPVAINLLNDAPPDTDPWPFFEAFFQQQDGLTALADALRVATIPTRFAQAGLDRIQQQNSSYDTLREAFVASGATPTPPRMNLDMNFYALQRMEHDVKGQGDPVRGEAIYRRPALQCAVCHAIGGGGGDVGPDLSSIGVTAPMDYLVESLLKPEQAVKDGYALVRVVRQDGRLVTGLLAGETGTALLVRDAAGNVTSVPTAQVRQREVLPGSLMPAGLTAQLDRDEFIDLVAFLSALGEEGAYRVPRTQYVRRWRVLSATEITQTQFQQTGVAFAAEASDLPWTPAYSTVAGTLPLDEVPVLTRDDAGYSFVQFDLDVQQAGVVVLGFNGSEGVSAWMGSQPVERIGQQMNLDLPAGMHRFTLALDRAAHGETSLAIELLEETTTARAAFVRGK